MFVHLQFPFTDLRRFVPSTWPRLRHPSWPMPNVGDKEFVRYFGITRDRRRGGLAGWIGEVQHCDARRALRFTPETLGHPKNFPDLNSKLILTISFRRLFFDGDVMGKIEVGFNVVKMPSNAVKMLDCIENILTIPVDVPTIGQCLLYEAGRSLADLFGRSTSKFKQIPVDGELNLTVRSEEPIIFLELSSKEAESIELPKFARTVLSKAEHGFALFFWRVTIRDRTISVWCAILGQLSFDPRVRNLRIYLLRLNAEHQALKRVLNAIGEGKIEPKLAEARTDFLKKYLESAMRRIGRCESKGKAYSSEIDQLAFSVFDMALPGVRDAVSQRLRSIEVQNNLVDRIDEYTARQIIYIESNTGVINMSNDTINVINSQNVNIKSKLENVQQNVGSIAAASEEQKKELETLLQGLSTALQAMPSEKVEDREAKDTITDLTKDLVDAAAKPEPNKTKLQLISDGLKKTASFLKEVAPSVFTIAGQIVSLVGKIHGLPL
jgi:hypothetical protein